MPAFNNTNQLIPARVYYYFQNKIDILSQNNIFKRLTHTFAFVKWSTSYSQVLSSYKNASRKSGGMNTNHYHVFSFYLYISIISLKLRSLYSIGLTAATSSVIGRLVVRLSLHSINLIPIEGLMIM